MEYCIRMVVNNGRCSFQTLDQLSDEFYQRFCLFDVLNSKGNSDPSPKDEPPAQDATDLGLDTGIDSHLDGGKSNINEKRVREPRESLPDDDDDSSFNSFVFNPAIWNTASLFKRRFL